jgi:hypothetical protein
MGDKPTGRLKKVASSKKQVASSKKQEARSKIRFFHDIIGFTGEKIRMEARTGKSILQFNFLSICPQMYYWEVMPKRRQKGGFWML